MSPRPLVFGEVLFDVFPDGTSVLGGAPFNVARHLEGFGQNPLMLSRVGEDDAGRDVLRKMHTWGMDIDGIQKDRRHPTGSVTVRLEQKEPSFTIGPEQAYDYLNSRAVESTVAKVQPSLLYHGTLALREDTSWKTFERLVASLDVSIFYDVNLRDPWCKVDRIRPSLEQSHWIKMNRAELKTLVSSPVTSQNDVSEAIELLPVRDEANVVITSGAGPVVARLGGEIQWCSVPAIDHVVDTVGAGDAFSAVLILGILKNWRPSVLLGRATQFGADVCAVRGATIREPQLYQERLAQWERP